jgi:transcriptional regulator with XRE-family HTH domain
MGIGNRLKTIREDLSETQKGLACLIGASHRTYQEWEAHNNVPNGKYLNVISQMGYNINWLLTGDGEMKIERIIGVQRTDNILSQEDDLLPFIASTHKDIVPYKIDTASLEPEINRGDVVFYDGSLRKNITDGALYVLKTPSGTMIKRLLYKGVGQIEAICNYSSFILDEGCEILGRVLYCLQAK